MYTRIWMIENTEDREIIPTSVKAFLSATLALCRRRITFFAPSTTAASILSRCRSSSTRSSKASSRLGSYLSTKNDYEMIVEFTLPTYKPRYILFPYDYYNI